MRTRHERAVMVFLQGLQGFQRRTRRGIRKRWGQAAIAKCAKIHMRWLVMSRALAFGLRIALPAMGVEPLSPLRLLVGVRHALATGCESGHRYLPEGRAGGAIGAAASATAAARRCTAEQSATAGG